MKKSMVARFGIALMLTALSWLAAAQQPNFGEVEFVEENATGYGPTKDIALLDALDNAISAVNGRRVASVTASMQSAIAVEYEGVSLGQIDTSAYMDAVVSSSQGAVNSYRIIEAIEVVSASNDSVAPSNDQVYEVTDSQWKVSVSALVARFNAGPDTGKPTLVVAIPRTSSSTFTLGDSNFQSTQVSKSLQTQLIDMLSQTERFEILGRDFDEELQSEIDFINSDRARSQDIVRLGQQFSADLILVTEIEQLEFLKSSRKLRTSDRELISYQGGGRIVARLMNAATGVLVASESFSIEIEPIEPSTMPRSVNGAQIANDVTSSMSGEVGAMIVRRVFPISVIDLTGRQVILSQGGDMIEVGERYEAVILGKELADPQTGRSLGRVETQCCVIEINRVTDQMSYGEIEGELPAELNRFSAGMVELRQRLVTESLASPLPRLDQVSPVEPSQQKKVALPKEDPDW